MKDRIGKELPLSRSHKVLMVLLLVGLTISVLAVVAPQAWATPDQTPLLQGPTIPPDVVGGKTKAANNLALLSPIVVPALVVVGSLVAAAIVWKKRHSWPH